MHIIGRDHSEGLACQRRIKGLVFANKRVEVLQMAAQVGLQCPGTACRHQSAAGRGQERIVEKVSQSFELRRHGRLADSKLLRRS